MRRQPAAEYSRADLFYSTEISPPPRPSRKHRKSNGSRPIAGGVTMLAAAGAVSQTADLLQPLGHFALGLAIASLPVGLVLACIWFLSTAGRRALGYLATATLLVAAISGWLSYKQWTTPDGERFGIAGASIDLVREVQGRLHLIERTEIDNREDVQPIEQTAKPIDQPAQKTPKTVEAAQHTGDPAESTAARSVTLDELRAMVQDGRTAGRPPQATGGSAGYVQLRASFSLFTAPAGGMVLMKVFGIDNFFFPLRLPPTARIDKRCLDDNRAQLQVPMCEAVATLQGALGDPKLRVYPTVGFPVVALDEVRVREEGQAR
jgi:hypothetical protein